MTTIIHQEKQLTLDNIKSPGAGAKAVLAFA
jgi:hypothetical protein